MIPNNTRVRIQNVHLDPCLAHVDGEEGKIVRSYLLYGVRYYLVTLKGLDYDLSLSEIEVL